MKIKTKRKPYKGYLTIPRAVMLLFQCDGTMDFKSFGFYLAIASECDWDRRHTTYGCLKLTDEDLARLWQCNSSTIWRGRKKLEKMGLLHTSEIGYPRLTYFESFYLSITKELGKLEFANSQEFIVKMQEKIADMQPVFANSQDIQAQNGPQSFNVSSKEDIGLSTSEMSEEERAWREEQKRKSEEMSEVANEVFGNWKPKVLK